MSKKVQISIDGGTTYFTFPGDTGDLQTQATAITDTVFGQNYSSSQTGIASWSLSTNGVYKGFAGYVAKINKGGTPTTMTAEATTLVSTRVYQITNAAHRFMDLGTTPVVLDNAIDHTANVLSIDYLNGIVTFLSTYTVVGPVTITGKYVPLTQIAKGQTFTLGQTSAMIDTLDFPTAQGNGGFKTLSQGLNTVALDIGGIYAISNGWLAALTARSPLLIEINPDGNEGSYARGIFKTLTQGQSGKVGELEMEAIKFALSVPDPAVYPLFATPFSWVHKAGTTTLSQALQNALTSWQTSLVPNFNYLYDGTNGQTGTGVITDISLTGGLDVMNMYTIKVSGSGALTPVGTG